MPDAVKLGGFRMRHCRGPTMGQCLYDRVVCDAAADNKHAVGSFHVPRASLPAVFKC